MCDPLTATLVGGALLGTYGSKREDDRAKRAAEKQKKLDMQPSEADLLDEARKRSRMARARAMGGYGLEQTINTGGALGNVGGGSSMLGG